MSPRVTIAVLAERVLNYHDDTKADLAEIKGQLREMNGTVRSHESRLSTVEGRQGLLVKIILGSLGSGSLLAGGIVAVVQWL